MGATGSCLVDFIPYSTSLAVFSSLPSEFGGIRCFFLLSGWQGTFMPKDLPGIFIDTVGYQMAVQRAAAATQSKSNIVLDGVIA